MIKDLASVLTDPPLKRNRSAAIDVLRGLFALWVVLVHLVPWTTVAQGPAAVPQALQDVLRILGALFQPHGELHPAVLGFIVLSGYCVHRGGFRAPVGDLARYSISRGFRILPIYFTATAFGAMAWWLVSDGDLPLTSALTGTQSIKVDCLAAKLSTFAAIVPGYHPCSYVGNAPLATVMVEITLYISYAVLFIFIWRGNSVVVWAICGVSWFAGLGIAGLAASNPSLYNWWQNSSLWSFLPYWWIGAAFLHSRIEMAVQRRWLIIAAMWLTVTILLWLGVGNAMVSEMRKTLFCIIIGFAVCHLDRFALSERNPMAFIGRTSYSLYAFAAPVTYMMAIFAVPWWANVAGNIAMGCIAYAAIERPMIKLGRTINQARQNDSLVNAS